MKEYSGYVTVREINELTIPITLQHNAMRNYCEQKKGIYKLAQTELVIKDSSLVLFSILKKLKKNGNAIMCSINMLPTQHKKREKIYKMIISKKIKLHFVFENFILANEKNISDIENFFSLVTEIKNNDFQKHIKKFKNYRIIN